MVSLITITYETTVFTPKKHILLTFYISNYALRFGEYRDLGIDVGHVVVLHLLRHTGGVVDGAQQNAAVLRGVGQPGKVDAVALAVLVDDQLAVLAVLRQDLIVLALRVDAARALAEINGGVNILQDKVVRVAGVVFVGA